MTVRPGLGAVRAADRQRRRHRRGRARCRQPAAPGGRLLRTRFDPDTSTARRTAGGPGPAAGARRPGRHLAALDRRVPRHQLGLPAHPQPRRRDLAPDPRPVHHPRDHPRRRPGRRRQHLRAARAPPGPRRPALRDRHRPDQEPAGQLDAGPARRRARVVERVAGEVLDTPLPVDGRPGRARPPGRPPPLDPRAAARPRPRRRVRRSRCSPCARVAAGRPARAPGRGACSPGTAPAPSATPSSPATSSPAPAPSYRRRRILEVDHVIGWNLRATWFQRRAGLTTLVATTAGGNQAVQCSTCPRTRPSASPTRRCPTWSRSSGPDPIVSFPGVQNQRRRACRRRHLLAAPH